MKRSLFSFKFFSFLAAISLGVLVGSYHVPYALPAAEGISKIFLNLLKLIGLPIIFLSITSTITGMESWRETKLLGKKVFGYTLLTTLIAASVGYVLFLTLHPATGAASAGVANAIQPQGKYLDFLMQAVPSNFLQPFLENNVIGVAFMAFLLSIATQLLPKEPKEFLHKLFSSLFAVLLKITGFIIALMPLGIFAFSALLARDFKAHFGETRSLALYLTCVIGANLLQGLVILPLLLKWKGHKPLSVAKGVLPALALAFFSKSSNATLPVAIRSVEDNLGVSPKVSQFSLPLCTVINMNGCAAFILITVLFVAMMHGYAFSLADGLMWIVLATLAAVGNAGVPMGCFFLASAFLSGMQVPLYWMGVILPFYSVLDMIETALNVWSDTCVTVIVDKETSVPVEAST